MFYALFGDNDIYGPFDDYASALDFCDNARGQDWRVLKFVIGQVTDAGV